MINNVILTVSFPITAGDEVQQQQVFMINDVNAFLNELLLSSPSLKTERSL